MRLFARTGLAIFLLAGAVQAAAQSKTYADEALPPVDHVVVSKAERTIKLFAKSRPVHTITGIQLGDAPKGHKRFQGDERTPEGRYLIDYVNANSAYHLSLHISYPNEADKAYARSQGRSPGGAIFIHGQPNGTQGRMGGDWTDGCIAVSNDEMDYLWQVVPKGTVIDILP